MSKKYFKELKNISAPQRENFKNELRAELIKETLKNKSEKSYWQWFLFPSVGAVVTAVVVLGIVSVTMKDTPLQTLTPRAALAASIENLTKATDQIRKLSISMSFLDGFSEDLDIESGKFTFWFNENNMRMDYEQNDTIKDSEVYFGTDGIVCNYYAPDEIDCTNEISNPTMGNTFAYQPNAFSLDNAEIVSTTEGLFLQWHTDKRYINHKWPPYMNASISVNGDAVIEESFNASNIAPDDLRYYDIWRDDAFQHSIQLTNNELNIGDSNTLLFQIFIYEYVEEDTDVLIPEQYSKVYSLDLTNYSIQAFNDSVTEEMVYQAVSTQPTRIYGDKEFSSFFNETIFGMAYLFLTNEDLLKEAVADEIVEWNGQTARQIKFALPHGALQDREWGESWDELEWRSYLPNGAEYFEVIILTENETMVMYRLLDVNQVELERIEIIENSLIDTEPTSFFTVDNWKKDL